MIPGSKKFNKKWLKRLNRRKGRERRQGFSVKRRMYLRQAQLMLNMTPHEMHVYRLLEELGIQFKPQKGFLIDGRIAIVDFMIDGWLIIEIDGCTHANPLQMSKDAIRDAHFIEEGYSVIRLTNKEASALTMDALSALIESAHMPMPTDPLESQFSAYCRHY